MPISNRRRFAPMLLLLPLAAIVADAQGARLTFSSIVAEQVDPSVPVSGEGEAIGLAAAASSPTDSQRSRLWVRLPADVDGILEVKIQSVDGRYLSTQHYKLAKGAAGWEPFELRAGDGATRSRRDALFKGYGRDHIAYAAALLTKTAVPNAAAMSGENAPLFFVSRVDPAATSKPLRTAILVNSLGAETVFVRVPGGDREPCKPVTGRATRLYDYACEAGLDKLITSISAPDPIRITRIRGANVLDPISITIR